MVALTFLCILVGLLAIGVWVGIALIGAGIVSLEIFRGVPSLKLLAQDIWSSMTSTELVALPLFILMGEILFYTRLAENLFKGLAPIVQRLPGRLLHINVLACTAFAAASGSSSATTATVGRITFSELSGRGYNRSLVTGSLCGAGTLGLLIPPSIILIIYGVLTDVSVLKLFLAGVIPGMVLAALFMGYLCIRVVLEPRLVPSTPEERSKSGLSDTLALVPPLGLAILVLGSMYAGVATPSEAAVVGVFGAVLIAAHNRTFTLGTLIAALLGTVRTCSMLGLITAGALFLAKAIAFLGLPRLVADEIAALGLGPYELILLLTVFYILLGTFLEGISMVVMTLPITFPLAIGAGWDPVWFGIYLIVIVEMSQITPPIGFNLFVVKQISGDSLGFVARSAFPFFLIMCLFTAVLVVLPGLVIT